VTVKLAMPPAAQQVRMVLASRREKEHAQPLSPMTSALTPVVQPLEGRKLRRPDTWRNPVVDGDVTRVAASVEDVAAGQARLPGRPFDVMLLKGVLHHVDDRAAFETARYLRMVRNRYMSRLPYLNDKSLTVGVAETRQAHPGGAIKFADTIAFVLGTAV
jgi:hypothetical protein